MFGGVLFWLLARDREFRVVLGHGFEFDVEIEIEIDGDGNIDVNITRIYT